jgi:hypothetical protein
MLWKYLILFFFQSSPPVDGRRGEHSVFSSSEEISREEEPPIPPPRYNAWGRPKFRCQVTAAGSTTEDAMRLPIARVRFVLIPPISLLVVV